ncbi:MAG: SNF2-related protein [Tepidisphaeraceae bacterium]
MSINALARKPEWYVGDTTTIAPLIGVPGIKKVSDVAWQIHRSHLPLLAADADAARILMPPMRPDWAARDLTTKDRGFTCRNVQHAGIDYITRRRGTLLGDDMRVGKTLTCCMSHDPSTGPLVVVCPAMVRPVWISWLSRVFPDVPIGVMGTHTFDHKIIQNPIIVGHYDILPWWQSALPIGTIIFDEAHVLTKRNSKRSKAAVFLASRAKRVIAATGTPIWNMPPDLWNVLGIVAPAAFGGFHEFSHRYGLPVPGAHGTKYTGISNEEELNARLSEVMIRRRWVDVADDLPPITRSVSLVEIDAAQRRRLDIIAAEIRQTNTTTIGLLSSYREKLTSIKRTAVVREANTILDRGEPVVLWTWHRQLAEQITADLGSRAFLLTGDVPNNKRDEAIESWKAHPSAALVCTMAVAQVGLDFSHAHLAIFAEIDYTPAVLAQAEMRTYAPTRPMNVSYLVADHMIDQRIVLALTRKLSAADPLGIGAANDAISALQFAVYGKPEEADLAKMLDEWLSS